MNLKSTFALLLLAACGGFAWYSSGTFHDPTGLLPTPGARAKADADASLLGPRISFRKVEIERGKDRTVLVRSADGSWRVAGGWRTRTAEVARLLDALDGLRSRFVPEENPDWASLGLARPAVKVTVTDAGGKTHTLALGDGPRDSGTRFDRPTYARLDGGEAAYRLAPGLVALLDRPADFYLRRRILDARRVKPEAGRAGTVEQLAGQAFTVAEKGERKFSLRHRDDAWELEYPMRDALEPRTRDALLEAAAELWAERFVPAPKAFAVERTFTLKRADGSETVLEIGPKVPGDEVGKPPLNYARLKGQDRYFEISLARLPSLDPPLATLRESQLARFKAEDVREVTLKTGKGTVVVRNEARPKPMGEDGPPIPPDWRIVSPLKVRADGAAVDKLLSVVSNLKALDPDAGLKTRLGAAVAGLAGPLVAGFAAGKAAPLLGVAAPGATVEVKTKVGEKEKTFTIRLGRHEVGAKKMYAMSGDWPRVNEISDEVAGLLVGKGALDYRSKKLLEQFPSDIQRMTVSRVDLTGLGALFPPSLAGPAFLAAGKPETTAVERTREGWAMTAPVKGPADEGQADDLAGKLAGLETLGFVADKVDAKSLQAAYGLGLPSLRATFSFRDEGSKARTLLVGKARPQGGWYARLEGEPEVFAIGKPLHDALSRSSLSYRPAQLWTFEPGDQATQFTIRRAGAPEYKLARKGAGWEVSGPFTVAAPPSVAERLVTALTAPRAERYVAHAGDAAVYGLDNPVVTVTMKTSKGKEHTLLLGKERFARLGKGAAVFLISDELARTIDQSPLDFLDRTLLAFDPAAAVRFVRQGGADELELAKSQDGWQIVKPKPGPADAKKVPELMKRFATLRARRFAAFDPKDLKQYGLDVPVTVRVKLAEGKATEKVLLIGRAAPGGSRYAQVVGKKAIAVISKDDAALLRAGPLAFRDHQVARLADADEARLVVGGRKATFAKPEGTWKLVKPVEAEADHDAMEAFFNGLARLRADEFITDAPSPADLVKYGLDRPETSWRFYLSGKEKLGVDVGKQEPGGLRRYARLQGKETVFLLDPKLSAQMVTEYRPRAVFKMEIDPASVDGIRFGYARDAFELKKVDGTWQFVGKPDEKVNVAALTDALSALRGLKLERYSRDADADLKLYGLDPVLLTLEVTTPMGKHTLLVGGIVDGTKKRYARHPGKTGAVFILDEAASVKLVRTRGELTAK